MSFSFSPGPDFHKYPPWVRAEIKRKAERMAEDLNAFERSFYEAAAKAIAPRASIQRSH